MDADVALGLPPRMRRNRVVDAAEPVRQADGGRVWQPIVEGEQWRVVGEIEGDRLTLLTAHLRASRAPRRRPPSSA